MDSIMRNLGLFGGEGPNGGAMASIFQGIMRMLYYLVTKGSIPVIATGVGVGSVVGGADGWLTGGFNPEASPPPLVTTDVRAGYDLDLQKVGGDQVSAGVETARAVSDEAAKAGQVAAVIEQGLADPTGGIAVIQNVGSAALLTREEVKRGNALLGVQTALELRREKERQDAHKLAVDAADRVFPQNGDGRLAADPVTFDPRARY